MNFLLKDESLLTTDGVAKTRLTMWHILDSFANGVIEWLLHWGLH